MLHFPLPYLMTVFDDVDHHGWKALPAAGGLDDQDADLVDDVAFLFTFRRYIQFAKLSGDSDDG